MSKKRVLVGAALILIVLVICCVLGRQVDLEDSEPTLTKIPTIEPTRTSKPRATPTPWPLSTIMLGPKTPTKSITSTTITTNTLVPTLGATKIVVPTLTSTLEPTLEVTPSPVCDCGGDYYNCNDFNSQRQAQGCYDYCVSIGRGDIHRLDRDKDGSVCESMR